MKKAVSILLCLMMIMCGGASVFASASIENCPPIAAPRFVNIVNIDKGIHNSGGNFRCTGYCQVAKRTTIKITITLKDEYGKRIASKSGNKTGTEYSFITDFGVTPGKKYKVEFAYDAGGERTSSTENITA